MREISDGQLVAKAASGDDSAFDELVAHYRTRVYHLALSKVRGRDNALDIAQEAFVQAYLSLKSLREPERFSAWLSGITANLCKMHFRKSSEVPIAPEMVDELRVAAEPDPNAVLAREALDRLPNGTRSAAILYFIEEMRQTEIAEFLGISLAAVKSRIRDARSSLQKEMVHMVKQTAKKEEPGYEFAKSLKHRLELARWYREFSDMVDAGVTLVRSLFTLSEGNYSQPIKDAATQVRLAVESGSGLSDALAEAPLLRTPESVGLVRAGEIGGNLELTLRTLADRIEAEEAKQNIELSFWCRILIGMLDAGVPPYDALCGAAEASRSKTLSQAGRALAACFEEDPSRQDDYDPFSYPPPPCPVCDEQAIRDVLDKYSDVFPPMMRVAIATGFGFLSITLEWARARIAEDICRQVIGSRIEVLTPRSELLKQHPFDVWARKAVELLKDDEASIRAAAAEMLGTFKVSFAADGLLELLGDPDPKVIGAAIRALVDLDAAPPTDTLTARLRMEDPSVRRASILALKELGRVHEASERLAELLADPDERVARAAISILEDAGEIEALGNEAVKLVQSSERPELRRRAADVLQKHLFPVQDDVLVAHLSDELPDVRFAAAKILGHRRDPRAVPAMREAVEAHRLSQDYLFLTDDLEKG